MRVPPAPARPPPPRRSSRRRRSASRWEGGTGRLFVGGGAFLSRHFTCLSSSAVPPGWRPAAAAPTGKPTKSAAFARAALDGDAPLPQGKRWSGPDGISFSAGDRIACKAWAHTDTPPTVVRTVLITARHPTLRCANDAAPTATALPATSAQPRTVPVKCGCWPYGTISSYTGPRQFVVVPSVLATFVSLSFRRAHG